MSTSRHRRLPSVHIGLVIATNEVRRSFRQLRDNDLFAIIGGLVGLFILIALPVLFSIARTVGEAMAAGNTDAVSTIIAAVSGLWVFALLFPAAEAMGTGGDPEHETCELAIRPSKDVAMGMFLHEAIWVSALVLVPTVVGLSGLAIGLGTPFPIVGGLIGIGVLLVTATLWGFVFGYVTKGFVRRSPVLSRLKPIVGTAFGIGVLVLIFSGRFVNVMIDLGTFLVDSPIGWLGHLTLATTAAAEPSITYALGAIVLAGIVTSVGILALVRAAEFAWFTDSIRVDGQRDQSISTSGFLPALHRLDVLLTRLGIHPITVAVAMTALTRAYRAPLQLLYLIVPLAVTLPVANELVNTGDIPTYTVWILLTYAGWAAGAVFPLNLLGEKQPILPTILTSHATPYNLVNGYILAGWMLVVIPAMILIGGAAWTAGFSIWGTLLIIVLTPVVALMGAALATGFGVIFPRLRAVNVTSGARSHPPSLLAFTVFSLVISVVVVALALLFDDQAMWMIQFVLSEHLPIGLDITDRSLEVSSSVALLLAALAAPLSYHYAISCLTDYQLE